MTPYALDHPAVAAYLQRLDAATAHLPDDERIEIQEGIRSHLIAALAEAHTEADVHQALESLGAPEEIVGLTSSGTVPAPGPGGYAQPPREPGSARGALEIIAVIFLLIGAFVVPFAGWVIGVVLLWLSKAWTTGEKVLGTLLLPGGLGATFLLIVAAPLSVQTCTGSTGTAVEIGPNGQPVGDPTAVAVSEGCSGMPAWLSILILAFFVLAPIVMSIYLLHVAGKRPASTT